jgi:hypothetical protein
MASELHKALCAALVAIALGFQAFPAVGATPEEKMFYRIQALSEQVKSKEICAL